MKDIHSDSDASQTVDKSITDKSANKKKHAWERLDPKQVLDDSGSQKMLKVHLDRYKQTSELVAGKNVLDIACGVGYGSQMLAEAGAATVVGVDICPDTIDHAKTTYQSPGLTYVCENAENFKWHQKFECIVSFETIEHLPHPEKFLDNIRELLTPEGILLLSAPLGETRHFDPYHLHAFSKDDILKLLQAHGFVIDSYRIDDCFLNRSELLQWNRLYSESSLSIRQLFFTWRGWYITRDFLFKGGFDIPEIFIRAHLNEKFRT